ncbi:MAG: Rpn family recombination-promoting nuclease/putative transposase [Holosporaceae bacterium]|jgi:predicted transposase/invertase (TIGR01784 family)|nr:Rpn family recombination-promoting nuclease/putative transposase [Holosporaceae bacterium]
MDSVTSDIVFKLVFGDERSKEMLIHLLNSVIVGAKENPIVEVTIRKTELTPEYVGGKEVRLDVVAEASDKRIINVEIQRKKKENFIKRSLFHWSELYFQQLPKGGDFIDLHQTVCINILEENLFKGEHFWRTYHMREDETHELLADDEEIHFLELRKMKKFDKDSPVTWWLEFIKNPHSEAVKQIGEFEPVIREAVKMFDIVTSDPQMRELIRMREDGLHDYNSDINSAKREGIEQGITRGKQETAISMLKDGMSVSSISKYTGLSSKEIEALGFGN